MKHLILGLVCLNFVVFGTNKVIAGDIKAGEARYAQNAVTAIWSRQHGISWLS